MADKELKRLYAILGKAAEGLKEAHALAIQTEAGVVDLHKRYFDPTETLMFDLREWLMTEVDGSARTAARLLDRGLKGESE